MSLRDSFVAIVIILTFLLTALPATAKKNAFYVANKKYRPKNQKILRREWSVTLKSGKPAKRYRPEASHPVSHDDVIYVGTHGKRFYAIQATNGKKIWQYKNDEPIASTAVVTGGRVYFTDLGGKVIALNKDDGSLAWQREFDSEMLGRPVMVRGRLILALGEREIIALSPDSGEVLWNQFIRTFIRDKTIRGHADVVAGHGRVYAGLADGNLYALNPANGTILWNRELSVPLSTFKDIDSALLVTDEALYVSGYFGRLYRLNPEGGQVKWTALVASGVRPLKIDNMVIVSDHADGSLDGFDAGSGKKIWSNELSGSVLSGPVPFADGIFVTSDAGEAYLVGPASGTQLQHLSISGGAINTPIISDSAIYVLTNTAKLVKLTRR